MIGEKLMEHSLTNAIIKSAYFIQLTESDWLSYIISLKIWLPLEKTVNK